MPWLPCAAWALLTKLASGVPWEVTNQEAVASWPEYATSVGLRLEADDSITVIAPHGLEDLFGCVVRRNPLRVSIDTYRQRIAQKHYVARWPKVQIVPC